MIRTSLLGQKPLYEMNTDELRDVVVELATHLKGCAETINDLLDQRAGGVPTMRIEVAGVRGAVQRVKRDANGLIEEIESVDHPSPAPALSLARTARRVGFAMGGE